MDSFKLKEKTLLFVTTVFCDIYKWKMTLGALRPFYNQQQQQHKVGLHFLRQWRNSKHLLVVTGQLANKPTRGQSSRGLVNSRTSQLAEMFDLKIGVYNSSKCYFGQITLFIRCQYSIGLELGLRLGLMCKYSTVIP